MRIESSVISMVAESSRTEGSTRDETLRSWVGSKGPDSEDGNAKEKSQNSNAKMISDLLDLSDQGLKELYKRAASTAPGTSGPTDEGDITPYLSDRDKQKLLMIQKMIEALTGKKLKFIIPDKISLDRDTGKLQIKLPQSSGAILQSSGGGFEYDLHEAYYEKQTLSFSAQGTAKTADGREIKLDVNLKLSREYASRSDISLRMGNAATSKDPLVVNFAAPTAELSENKVSFDLDADGTADRISFVKSGSGFLALDVNNDGVINDGSELFGPQSGDGFANLSKYDADGNGWIDEDDEIYDKLRIWTKDDQGNDQLFALGQKGVGAIYLGNAVSSFQLKGTQNQLLGNIGSTGIFLRENGTTGTIQHIDLAV